jgi:hypothetical protein
MPLLLVKPEREFKIMKPLKGNHVICLSAASLFGAVCRSCGCSAKLKDKELVASFDKPVNLAKMIA